MNFVYMNTIKKVRDFSLLESIELILFYKFQRIYAVSLLDFLLSLR